MRVQLLNPPVHHYQGVHYRINPPLSLPILAAVLHRAGHHAEVYDLEALHVCPDAVGAKFAASRDNWPDVIGLTALTSSARGAQETVAAIRAAGYDRRIVVGGIHATLFPEQVLAWGVDTVITGECEGNLVGIMELGLTGVQEGQPPVEMADLPIPAWDYHRPQPTDYTGNAPHLLMPEAITMWTRGCPHTCVFCGNSIFNRRPVRYRPAQAIIDEVRHLRDRGAKAMFVYDDELVGHPVNETWWHALTDGLAAMPNAPVWKCQGRCSAKRITHDVLRRAYAAGCRTIMWGCESFSDAVLKAVRKGTHAEDNWHSLRVARDVGIRNFVFTMVGSPDETDAECKITADALGAAYREGLVQYLQTTAVTALPGTELWDRQHAEGWFVEPPTCGPQMAQVYAPTPWLSGERIAYWMDEYRRRCPVGYDGGLIA